MKFSYNTKLTLPKQSRRSRSILQDGSRSPFLNNPEDLDPSYKMDLDLWDCFGRKKTCLITEEIRYLCLVFKLLSHPVNVRSVEQIYDHISCMS